MAPIPDGNKRIRQNVFIVVSNRTRVLLHVTVQGDFPCGIQHEPFDIFELLC